MAFKSKLTRINWRADGKNVRGKSNKQKISPEKSFLRFTQVYEGWRFAIKFLNWFLANAFINIIWIRLFYESLWNLRNVKRIDTVWRSYRSKECRCIEMLRLFLTFDVSLSWADQTKTKFTTKFKFKFYNEQFIIRLRNLI